MNVRFKKTDKGEMAILPRAEYEALIERLEEAEEDAGTVRLIDRGLREIAEGAPTFPMDVANRIADGENPVRVFREWKGMTQVELAARTGSGSALVVFYSENLEGTLAKVEAAGGEVVKPSSISPVAAGSTSPSPAATSLRFGRSPGPEMRRAEAASRRGPIRIGFTEEPCSN